MDNEILKKLNYLIKLHKYTKDNIVWKDIELQCKAEKRSYHGNKYRTIERNY